jgi:hypothetical protein
MGAGGNADCGPGRSAHSARRGPPGPPPAQGLAVVSADPAGLGLLHCDYEGATLRTPRRAGACNAITTVNNAKGATNHANIGVLPISM